VPVGDGVFHVPKDFPLDGMFPSDSLCGRGEHNSMKTLWELRHGLLLLVGFGVFYAAAANLPWILAIPVILILIGLLVPKMRGSQATKKRGYLLIWRGEGRSSYEELTTAGTRIVELPSQWTEVGRPELFIPTKTEWELKAPEWAANRRDEIFQRVIAVWNGFEIHYPADWPVPPKNNEGEQDATI
jgi:hypothetical protein